MYRIRRFGVIKTANIVALMYMLIVAIFFVPLAILTLAGVPGSDFGVGVVTILLLGLLVVVVYAAIGWIFTAIACAIYNVAAGWVGGIEVQVEPVIASPPPPDWGPGRYPAPRAPPPAE